MLQMDFILIELVALGIPIAVLTRVDEGQLVNIIPIFAAF